MKKNTKKSRSPLGFYLAFFGGYFVFLYLVLYRANGLHFFQINSHFFFNVVGSLSTRFFSEITPYAFFFALLFYAKQLWLRLLCLAGFLVTFWLNLANIIYYTFAKTHFQLYVLESFRWPLLKSFFDAKTSFFLFVFFALTCLILLQLFRMRSPEGLPAGKKIVVAALLFSLMSYQAYIAQPIYDTNASLFIRDGIIKKTGRVIDLDASGVENLSNELIYRFTGSFVQKYRFSEAEQEVIEAMHLDTQLSTPFKNPPKKIVLVVAESLNQDFLSAYNSLIPGTTPFLDDLLTKYPHIDNFYPSGPFTIQGLSSMLCGHTNLFYGRELPQHECVPRLLSHQGYKNEFIRGFSKYYIGENVTFKKFGFDRIFALEDLDEKYPDFKKQRPDLYSTWGFSDDYLFNEAIERLSAADADEKLFLTLLTVDTHSPGGRCFKEEEKERGASGILFSSNCFDTAFQNFISTLEEKGLLDENTVVLLTSDQLLPNFSDVPGDSFQISFALPPARIPFLMITQAPFEFKARQGSQVDIAGTLLDLTNTPLPNYYMGKSLLSNPYTFPTGVDRDFAYLISEGHFTPLSTHFSPPKSNEGRAQSQLLVTSGEDMMEKVDLLRREGKVGVSENNLLHKWHYNKYYFHN